MMSSLEYEIARAILVFVVAPLLVAGFVSFCMCKSGGLWREASKEAMRPLIKEAERKRREKKNKAASIMLGRR